MSYRIGCVVFVFFIGVVALTATVVNAGMISPWVEVSRYISDTCADSVDLLFRYNASSCYPTPTNSRQYPYYRFTCNMDVSPAQVNRTAWIDATCTTAWPTPTAPASAVFDPNTCENNDDDDHGYKYACVTAPAPPVPPPVKPACPDLYPPGTEGSKLDCLGVIIPANQTQYRNGVCDRRFDCWQFSFDGEDCLYYSGEQLIDSYDCNGRPYPYEWFNDRTCDGTTAHPPPARSYGGYEIVLNCSAKNFDGGYCFFWPDTTEIITRNNGSCLLSQYKPILRPSGDGVDPADALDTYAAGTLAATVLLFGLLAAWCVWHRRNSIRAANRASEQLASAQFAEVPLTAVGRDDRGGAGVGGARNPFAGASFTIGESGETGVGDDPTPLRSPIDANPSMTANARESERARFIASADDAL